MNNTHTQREIRFRAWDKDKKQWVYARLEDPGWCIVDNMFDAGELSYWQQYTGLKDKNGKEIYEGDIVTKDGKILARVDFHEGKFIVVLSVPVNTLKYGFAIEGNQDHWAYLDEKCEVIGNIYENPELIEEK